jgi:hypothetical protein
VEQGRKDVAGEVVGEGGWWLRLMGMVDEGLAKGLRSEFALHSRSLWV